MVYLDHAATTPMSPLAREVFASWLGMVGNASSLHASGRRARRGVEEAREAIAQSLGAEPSEVVFTAGGTESDNLAIKGIYWQRHDASPRRRRVLVTGVEHHAVLDTVHWLADHEGAEIESLPVDAYGRLAPETLEAALAADPDSVALVTVMWANNEVGTVQPIARLAEIAHAYGVPIHCDAVQAVGVLPVDFAASGLDALSLTGHKLGGPLGVGALLLRRQITPVPLLHGGGQERDVRSGTLDTPAIAAFGAAVREAVELLPEHATSVAKLRDDLIDRMLTVVPEARLSGDPSRDSEARLPGIAHFCFPGCEGDALLLLLDARGVECSTGSACSAGIAQPSHVLLAMGASEDLARGSLRFSLGRDSVLADIDALIDAIGPAVERARAAGLS
jgi:cysteine desulfurase